VKRNNDPDWYEEKHPERDCSIVPKLETQPLEPTNQDFDHHSLLPTSQDDTSGQDTKRHLPLADQHIWFQRILEQFLIIAPFIIIAFWGGWFSHIFFSTVFLNQSNQSKADASLIQEAWNKIDQNYVDHKDLDYKKMAYAAITAMVQSLGDTGHSRFMTPQNLKDENQQLNGQFTGIGLYLLQDPQTKTLIVNSTIPGSPANKAGLKHGDTIVAINGVNMEGKDLDSASNLIEGQAGTSVTLTIQQPGEAQLKEFQIARADIQIPNVSMYYIPKSHIADIQVIQFASGVSNQLQDAINQGKRMGATKIILDLRNNPGGLLQEAINTTSLFLKTGHVLIEEDSTGKRTTVPVNGNPIDTSSQIIVLINNQSASSAEIVSGALKDNHRAILLGQKTYGTGTVLQQFILADGSALYLGTQEWLTPNGHFIRQVPNKPNSGGISPNITVSLTTDTSMLTPNEESQQHLTEQQILASGDTQLSAAINYLLK
jgi:carboxyl-terminal processing protease